MRCPTLLAGLLLLAACVDAAENPYGLPDGLYSEITSPRGVVVCELYYEKTPLTVANHVGLAEGTLGPAPRKPFYVNLKFHRVVPGFVAQGGDGGEIGYEFPDECVPGLRHDGVGVMQMANAGPDTNGSQFCLMLGEAQRLNYLHTVFGHVVRGIEVLPKIQQDDRMDVKILRLGEKARAFRADEAAFAELLKKAKRYNGPADAGPEALFDDPDKVLPTDIPRAQHFAFKLANFERFTGGRVAARVLAKAPREGTVEEYLNKLTDRMKVAERGAAAVYVAEQDRWYVRVGKESAARFVGNNTDGVDKAIEQLLAEAKKKGAELIAASEKNRPAGQPLAETQKVKLRVDALLDLLLFRMEPK